MSAGLRVLIGAAKSEPLPFTVTLYAGQMVITGRIAPADWFFKVSHEGYRQEVWVGLQKVRNTDERQGIFQQEIAESSEVLQAVATEEPSKDVDEVTLVDVSILPAVSAQGTQSGGHTLPVARVPLASISTWWIVSGEEIRGQGGSSVGWGFLFPINV
jgi:hypothetical protein